MSLLPLHQLAALLRAAFDDLPQEVLAEVEVRAKRRTLAAGERLYCRGDDPDGIYRVLEGVVRVDGTSALDQVTVLDFYGPGSWIGEVATLDRLPRAHDAHAHGRTVVLHLATGDVEGILDSHPAFGRTLLQVMAIRERILLTALESYSTQPLEQRLANRLLMLAASHGLETAEGVTIELHLPQETLAQLIGGTRQRVNQIVKAWEAEGVVAQRYGSIQLLDRVRLEALGRS